MRWGMLGRLRKTWQRTNPKGRRSFADDAMLDAAYEARSETALEWLKESEGDREFTDEEIEDAAHELDQASHDLDDYY